jgi:hypothetical protein
MSCKVIDIFTTSIGNVAILGFSGDLTPSKGMVLMDENNDSWRIIGMGVNKKEELNNSRFEEYTSIWDCQVESVTHTRLPIKGSSLAVHQIPGS